MSNDRTPVKSGTHTPVRSPVNTGPHTSGGEWQQKHSSTPNRTPAFDRGVVKQHSGNGKK